MQIVSGGVNHKQNKMSKLQRRRIRFVSVCYFDMAKCQCTGVDTDPVTKYMLNPSDCTWICPK